MNPHRQVDVGWNDACVLERDGTVRCWGTNEFGPVSQVPADLPPAVSVSVGTGFACVMTVDRQARCWGVQGHGGWPAHGQTEVPADLGQVTQVSADGYHSCALLPTGKVRCWGLNQHGQLNVPSDLGPVAKLLVNGLDTCVLLVSGGIRCWGHGGIRDQWRSATDFIDLDGNGTVCGLTRLGSVLCDVRPADGAVWSPPADLPATSAVAVGAYQMCFLLESGSLRCVGHPLSDGTQVPAGLPRTRQVASGGATVCAVATDESVRCWGGNPLLREPADLRVPLAPSDFEDEVQHSDPAFARSYHDVCLNLSPTKTVCANAASEPPAGVVVESVMPGLDQSCGIRADDSVVCWATGRTDTPYDASAMPALTPPADLGPVLQLSAGWRHMCALTVTRAVRCWGSNDYRDVNYGYQFGQTAVPDDAKSGVRSISGSHVHTCAIKLDGRVLCWGSNWYGQTSVPNDMPPAKYVAVGDNSCAVTSGGEVRCWGRAQAPSDLGLVREVRDGWFQECALTETGRVRCWGRTWPSAPWVSTTYDVPPDVQNAEVSSIATTSTLSCAYIPGNVQGSRVRCWGRSPDATIAEQRLNIAMQPHSPKAVLAQAGDASALVSWSVPESDGGSSITGYTVTASPGGRTCSTSGLSCTVVGLQNRREYSFTVTATNSAGTSEPSDVSKSVVPLAPGFQVWADNHVLAVGSSTMVRCANAVAGATVSVSGRWSGSAVSDATGSAALPVTALQAGVAQVSASYFHRNGRRTMKRTTSSIVYVPKVFGPLLKIKAGKQGKFTVSFAPPGAAVSIALSDGRVIDAIADASGKVSATEVFTSRGAVTYTVTVAGVQVANGGLTVS
ncbi:MAG: fibronectin type III domain-containing protein [Actinomycetales bacterium]|nr:fibronectin type III domain-containing protein [Actinomycetales bacterium]